MVLSGSRACGRRSLRWSSLRRRRSPRAAATTTRRTTRPGPAPPSWPRRRSGPTSPSHVACGEQRRRRIDARPAAIRTRSSRRCATASALDGGRARRRQRRRPRGARSTDTLDDVAATASPVVDVADHVDVDDGDPHVWFDPTPRGRRRSPRSSRRLVAAGRRRGDDRRAASTTYRAELAALDARARAPTLAASRPTAACS